MHELSLCEAILGSTTSYAEGRRVTQVTVRVGHLRQVVPDALLFSWEVLTDSTGMKGCELRIEEVPAVVECSDCGARTTLDVPVLCCATCESFNVTLVSGEELVIVSMDLVDA